MSQRRALLIGVPYYQNEKQIKSFPEVVCATGEDLQDALEGAGFSVQKLGMGRDEEEVLTKVRIRKEVRRFLSLAPTDSILFVYFTGHGIQHNGKTLLLPYDAEIENEEDFADDFFDMDLSGDFYNSRANSLVVCADACREKLEPKSSAVASLRQMSPTARRKLA